MQQNGPRKLFRVNVDPSGRLELPTRSRVREAALDGEPLFAMESPDGSFKVQTRAEIIREIQDFASRL